MYVHFSHITTLTIDIECSKLVVKVGKKEQHLWQKRDSAGSGQKALNLVRIVSPPPPPEPPPPLSLKKKD